MLAQLVELGVRDSSDDWTQPWLGSEGQPELAPGEQEVFWVHAAWAEETAQARGEAATNEVWSIHNPVMVHVTTHRVIWVAREWHRTSFYMGAGLIGGGIAFAGNMLARYKAKQAEDRFAVAGQMRYEWATLVLCRHYDLNGKDKSASVSMKGLAAGDPIFFHEVSFGAEQLWAGEVAQRILEVAGPYVTAVRQAILPREHRGNSCSVDTQLSWNESNTAAMGDLCATTFIGTHLAALPVDDPERFKRRLHPDGAPPGYRN
jgi:hypothetical protein